MIKLKVSAANIAVEEKETLTEGRVGLQCRFSFTGEWDGLAKTAVFDGADSRDVILTEDTVAVPAECLAAEGYSLSVGVYGKNAAGDIVIPTVYATVGKIQRSAYPSGKETAAPTPDVVAQIQQAAANAEAMARSVREDADLGKFNGGQGPQGPAGATGPKGDTGAAGEAGGYYTPAVTQPDANTLRVAFTPSKENMPSVEPADIAIPSGGGSGTSGEDGGYYAPSVDNAGNLSWTASKTDMPAVEGANIKGPKGDTGAPGAQGPQGPAGANGADGKSAYAYAVEGGYTGTETEFAAKLAAEMPTTLPNPNALTFTGAVTGSYDGSAALSVKIPSGGGGRDSRLICDITLSEDAYSIEITSDLDGNSFELSEVWIFYEGSGTHTKNTYLSVSSVENPSKRWISIPEGTSQSGTSRKGCVHGVLMAPGIIRGDTVALNSNSGPYPNSAYNEPVSAYEDKITSIKLFTNNALSYAFVAGFRVRVYGR